MTPMRKRMIEQMQLAGLAPRTQEVYLQGVGNLVPISIYRDRPSRPCEVVTNVHFFHNAFPVRHDRCKIAFVHVHRNDIRRRRREKPRHR